MLGTSKNYVWFTLTCFCATSALRLRQYCAVHEHEWNNWSKSKATLINKARIWKSFDILLHSCVNNWLCFIITASFLYCEHKTQGEQEISLKGFSSNSNTHEKRTVSRAKMTTENDQKLYDFVRKLFVLY